MKHTRLRGIAHDLANHLEFEIWYNKLKNVPKELKTDVMEQKDAFDCMCHDFFRDRLPPLFDMDTIDSIEVWVKRSMSTLKVKVTVKIKGRTYARSVLSMHS